METLDKTVVITGASRGLGRETAVRLSRKYANVVLVARSQDLLDQLQKEIAELTGRSPLAIACDVADEDDVKRMAAKVQENFNCVDVLINNAGIGIHKVSEQMTGEEMRKQFAVNVFGPFYCIQALLPLLKLGQCGYVLNVGSLVSKVSFADNSVYAATKSALAGFSEGLRHEMKKLNIKIGLFLPGLMNTAFQADRVESAHKVPSFLILDPKKAAEVIEKMIGKRKKKVYLYRWMLWLMKTKQLFA
jgi:short-subunit dehydrogenase